MFGESFFWIICPLIFIGMMIICMIISRRRGRWSCCFPSDNIYDYRDRIQVLENEIEKLKDKQNMSDMD